MTKPLQIRIIEKSKGYEEEEYTCSTIREDGSPAERLSGQAQAEGSFGTGRLKGRASDLRSGQAGKQARLAPLQAER